MSIDSTKYIVNQSGKIKIIMLITILVLMILVLIFGIKSFADDEDTVTLSIITKNEDSSLNLKGAKYSVKVIKQDKDGNEIEEDAKDYKDNYIGNSENINGTEYRIVESNSNGEINLKLPSGKYKVTEIQAPDGYKLNDNNIYEVNLESKGSYIYENINKEWERTFSRDTSRLVIDIKETTGEEYLSLVLIEDYCKIPGEEFVDNGEKLFVPGFYIFRYSADNKIKEIVQLHSDNDQGKARIEASNITAMFILNETPDYYIIWNEGYILYFDKTGNYINTLLEGINIYFNNILSKVDENDNITIVGNLYNNITIPQEETTNNREINIGTENKKSYIILQVNAEGKINWAIDLKEVDIGSNLVEKDNQYLIEVYGLDTVINGEYTVDGNELNLKGINKLFINNDGKIEKAENESFLTNIFPENNIIEFVLTNDGGKIVDIMLNDDITINKENTASGEDILLKGQNFYTIKFNNENKVEWQIPIINIPILEVNNGYFTYAITVGNIDGKYTANGNSIEVENNISGVPFALTILKIDKAGKIKYSIPIEKANEYQLLVPYDLIELENNKYVFLKQAVNNNIEEEKSISTNILTAEENLANKIQNYNELAKDIDYNEIYSKLEKYVEFQEQREKIDKQTINVTNKTSDALQIVKKDSKTAQLLPGAKFTIKKIITNADGNITKEDAIRKDGSLVGEIENINGEDIRVVTTNENGEINEDLPIGKYEIVEVKAPDGYNLKPTVEENTYEVEITEKQAEKKEWKETWNRIVGFTQLNTPQNISFETGMEEKPSKILSKDDTGVIVYLNTYQINIPAEDTVNNKAITKNNPVIIKYNLDNKVEWVRDTIQLNAIYKTEKNEYIIGGYINNNQTIGADATINNQEILLGYGDTIIKLNSDFLITSVLNLNIDNSFSNNEFTIHSYNGAIIPAISMADGKERRCESGRYFIKINDDLKIENIIGPFDEIFDINNNNILLEKTVDFQMNISTIDGKQKELIPGKKYIMKCDLNGNILNIFEGMDEIQDFIKDTDGYLFKVYNENNVMIPAENTVSIKDTNLKNYMFVKLDNNLKLVNNTQDFWKNTKSYEKYLDLLGRVKDGYLIKVFSAERNTIEKANTVNNEDINISAKYETVIKLNKDLKAINILDSFYINTYYTGKEDDFVVSSVEGPKNGIFRLYRNYSNNKLISAEDTVNNQEISITRGYHYILYNEDFKVIAVDVDMPEYITDSGYIYEEYNSSDTVIPAEYTVDNKEIVLKRGASLILCNKQMKVIRVHTGYVENINSDYGNLNQGYYFVLENNNDKEITIPAENTTNNQPITIEPYSKYIALYDKETLKITKLIFILNEHANFYKTADGGYISGGYLEYSQTIPGEYTENGKDIEIQNLNSEYVIKYNADGKIQYVLKGYDLISETNNADGSRNVITKNRNPYNDSYYYTLFKMDSNWNFIREIDNFLLNTTDGGYIYNIEFKTNITIMKEYNTKGEDLFFEKGKYIVKETADGKLDWAVATDNFLNEIEELNNGYFGTYSFLEGYDRYAYEIGCLKITQELISEQLMNTARLNVADEGNVGKVIVKFLDRETNKELAESEELEDKVGADYETESKNIQYYNLVETPDNANGKVKEGVTEVIYYYDKQDFNIKTEKTISEVYINGEKQKIKGSPNNLFQVSIDRKEVSNSIVKIKYTIKIENTGEIPGTAGIVTDEIPEGLEFNPEDNADYWKLQDGKAITSILDGDMIEPGGSRELEIVLRTSEIGNKLGVKNNKAIASNMRNEPRFNDSNSKDDLDECKLLVSVKTGGTDVVIIELIALVFLGIIGFVISIIRKKTRK